MLEMAVTNTDGGKLSISKRKGLRKICGQLCKENKGMLNCVDYTKR